TFLLLTQKAATICRGASVGSWLYGVAYRMALNAKRTVTKQRVRERQTAQRPQPAAQESMRELQAIIDAEVNRLPKHYHSVFLLCCLEGKSKAETARELGCKEGTVSSRLARVRKILQGRLTRRGITLSAALATVHLSQTAASALVPAGLAKVTRLAACQ